MRIFSALTTFLLLFLLCPSVVKSQCNQAPCLLPMPSVNAQDACVSPSPSALDCYFGATTPDAPVSFPPSWCTTVENNHWFAFVADATSATFTFNVYGCAVGGAIQAAAFSTSDCVNFQFVSPCLGNIPSGGSATLVASPLTPGETYYIMIDGSAGAQCDYSINGTNPTINGPTDGVCLPSLLPSVYTTSSPSTWSLNPPTAGTMNVNPANTQATIQWLEPGPAQICAQGINCPNSPEVCLDINIGEVVMTEEEVFLCQGKKTECAGKTFSAPGNFPVILKADTGCDSIVTCKIKLIPTVTVTEFYELCSRPGESVSCAGQDFYAAGVFPVTLTTDQGCDSIVRCSIKVIPTYISPFTLVNLCGPAEYQICNNTLNESGLHSETCLNYQGCDSIVNVNLAIMEPQALIAAPSILDCDSNAIVTLNGAASPPNPVSGGITLYNWSGPGIVGPFNQPTAQVNQPGQYCLIVTHARGGVYCADTTCVTVLANSAIPQLPVISGNPNPCGDSTLLYTVTATGNPPPTSFNWISANNTPITALSLDSILITWSNVVLDTLCVTANNSCGASLPACMPITVQQPIVSPQLAGPAAVCANGGLYLFTLDTQQVGVNYNWTVPFGAVLTGSGDSISVDFSNASGGQVCVTATNLCGALPPICQNVQVSPTPTVALSGGGQICDGQSITLTFSTTGNGPFDVVWSNGAQNNTLNDINNGHTITLTPLANTNYTLVSGNDGSTPACTAVLSGSAMAIVQQNYLINNSIQICEGESVLLGGSLQTTSGIYTDSLNSIFGCDSVIVTALTVFDLDTTQILTGSCDPGQVGVFTQTLTQTNGCDSVVITTVNLLPTSTTNLAGTSCDPALTGVFVQNLTNQFGCDSTVTLTVTYSLSDTVLVFGSSCNPAEVGVFSENYISSLGCDSVIISTISFIGIPVTQVAQTTCDPAAAGVFNQTLITADGCDSTIVTTVTLLPSSATTLTGQSCNPANVGTFVQNLTNAVGCDSIVTTTISFFQIPPTPLTATTCDPAAAGVFSQTLTTAAGCDSTIVTTVSLLPSSATTLTGQSCNPANVGTFVQNLTNAVGCDSIVTTTISFFQIPPTPLTATTCDPAAAGVFSETLTTAAGCDSTVVTTVLLLPSSATALTGQSCNPANVGTFVQNLTNAVGCDSIVTTTISFFQIPPTPLTATTCNPAAAGVFSQTLTTAAGCDSTIVTTVSLLPSNQVSIQSTTCNPAAAGVFVSNLTNQFGCDSIVTTTVALLPSNTTNLTATTCEQNEVGTVTQVLTNQFGCDSTVITTTSLLPPANCGAAASATGSNIPCTSNTGTITVTATLGIPPFSFDVLSAGNSVATGVVNAIGVPQTVSGLPAGNYTIVFTASTGFTTTAQATVVQLLPPVISAIATSDFGGFNISCDGGSDGSATATVTGGKFPYSYAWSTGSASNSINNLSAGTYSLTVTDANNCTATGTAALTDPEPLAIAFTVTDITCFGRRDGTITVDVTGGIPPYRYALNFGGLQASNTYTGLTSGTFTIRVEDASGCETAETIVVNSPPPFEVELGNTQIIALGDSTNLKVLVNVPLDSIQSVVWGAPLDTTDCTTCLEYTVAPFITTTYSVTVVTTTGCTDADQVTVFVDRRRYLYVPNAFSPNGDGDNDILEIFAKPNTVKNIKTMQIFNRWGEALYQLDNFQPNNPTIGWNGNFRGEPMNPGVFAWMLEVEFIDGVTEVFTGDVTIVR